MTTRTRRQLDTLTLVTEVMTRPRSLISAVLISLDENETLVPVFAPECSAWEFEEAVRLAFPAHDYHKGWSHSL